MDVKAELYQKRAAKLLLAVSRGEDPYKMEEYELNRQCIPERLYKYHAVDDYTVDAMRNDYLYIAPASLMDDQFELALNVAEGIRDTEALHRFDDEYFAYYWDVVEHLSPVFGKEVRAMREALKDDFTVETADEYCRGILDRDPNFRSVYERFERLRNGNSYREDQEQFFRDLLSIREDYGLHSLTEDGKNQVMWCMYGADYKGIMIEYDMSAAPDEAVQGLVKVRYSGKREADPMKLYVDMMVSIVSGQHDMEYYLLARLEWMLKILATKNTEWGFQKEWRVISGPATKIKAPPVSAVYLGKRISDADRQRIYELSREKGFGLFTQEDDFNTMALRYSRIE